MVPAPQKTTAQHVDGEDDNDDEEHDDGDDDIGGDGVDDNGDGDDGDNTSDSYGDDMAISKSCSAETFFPRALSPHES